MSAEAQTLLLSCKQVTAALSAAVTTAEVIGDAPTFQAEPTLQKPPTQTPAAFREGARGRTFLRKAASLAVPLKSQQDAAALSAAVTTAEVIGDALIFQAELTMQKPPTQTPAAFREGARGRGLSQKGRLPRNTPKPHRILAMGFGACYNRFAYADKGCAPRMKGFAARKTADRRSRSY